MRRDLFLRLLFSSVFLILAIDSVQSQSKLPVYEAFDYIADEFLHNQTGWSLAYTGTEPVIKSGSLEYEGLPASKGNKVSFDGSGADPFLVFSTQNIPDSKVYYSFILRVTSVAGINTSGAHFAGFQNGTTGGAMVWIKPDGNGGFYIGHSSRAATGVSWTTASFQVDAPIFIAVCYEIAGQYNSALSPGDDKTYLWVNPEASSFGVSSSPDPTISCTMVTGTPSKDLADLKSFYIRQDAATTTPFIELDELRIGLSWKEVTAETAPPSWQPGFPKIEGVTSSAFTVVTGLTEPGKAYFSIFPAGTSMPSTEAVKAGTGSIINGLIECPDENLSYSLPVEGLSGNTEYAVFCAGEDIYGNLQAEPVLVSVTTLRADPPLVSPASIDNDVDHDIDLVFVEDEIWRLAVNDIKVGGMSLDPDDWDNSSEGKITLRPLMGNPLLTVAGLKTIMITAHGYNDAIIEQAINCGGFSIEKSSNSISGPLHPGEEVMVTLAARDQFSNPLPGYIFKIDGIVTNVTNVIDEVHKINGTDYSTTTENIELSPAGAEGISEISIMISGHNDALDGFTVIIHLNDGLTEFGSYSYIEPASAASSDAGLSTLSIDGEMIAGFDKNILSYDFILESGATGVPALDYTLSDNRAAAVLIEASSLPGSSSITVTAEDGVTIMTYIVNFKVADPSHDSALIDIIIDDIPISGFDSGTFDYTFLLPFGSQSPPVVSATASEYSSMEITQPLSVTGTSEILVTAQDGISQSTYTITFGIDEYIYKSGFENDTLPFPGWKAFNAVVEYPVDNHASFTGNYAISFYSGSMPGRPGFSGFLKTLMYPNSGKLEFWASDQSSDGNEKLLIHKRTRNSADSVLVAELTSVELSGSGWNYYSFDIDAADSTYIVFTSVFSAGSETRLWIDDLSLKGKIITSVPFLFTGDRLKIYPDPVGDQLNLELYENEIKSISIYNSAGIKLLESRTTGSAVSINVSSLHDGYYIIMIKVNEGIILRKFLKI